MVSIKKALDLAKEYMRESFRRVQRNFFQNVIAFAKGDASKLRGCIQREQAQGH
jgi:hypothetical protein